MIPSFSRVILAFALALGCAQTQARCVGFMPEPGETDPLKAAVKHALGRSTAVFVGTVTAMEYVPVRTELFGGEGQMLVIRLAASAWWKGAESQQVTLHTFTYLLPGGGNSMEAHEYRYEEGKTYLVFAHASGGALYANKCTRTKLIEAAADDIALLDALKAGYVIVFRQVQDGPL